MICLGFICSIAIFNGASESVFKMIGTVMTHFLSVGAGIGLDRVWINRKKTGISSGNGDK